LGAENPPIYLAPGNGGGVLYGLLPVIELDHAGVIAKPIPAMEVFLRKSLLFDFIAYALNNVID
jgi:hypothetical protein